MLIQWGYSQGASGNVKVIYPISFNTLLNIALGPGAISSVAYCAFILVTSNTPKNTTNFYWSRYSGNNSSNFTYWMATGY